MDGESSLLASGLFQTIAGTLRKPYIRSPEQEIKFLCNLTRHCKKTFVTRIIL